MTMINADPNSSNSPTCNGEADAIDGKPTSLNTNDGDDAVNRGDHGSNSPNTNTKAASSGAATEATQPTPAAPTSTPAPIASPNPVSAAAGKKQVGAASTAALSAQLNKLREANSKYKNLLKMAKERIQEQEGILEERRAEAKQLTSKLNESNQQVESLKKSARRSTSALGLSPTDDGETTIIRVCQRVKEEIDETDGNSSDEIGDASDSNNNSEDLYEIWALLEHETATPDGDALSPLNTPSYRRYKEWHRFTNESALADYIRRDTGEPLTLPPYSLSPEQSQKIAEDAKKAVASITEEFRRFRVRAEVAKKQADATVRALHSNSVQTTRMRIEGQDIASELAQAKNDHAQLTALRAEMAEQEARWKESYDLLLAENEKLKSSGAEALLAAQWRHRYEACLKEKEDALTNLEMEREKVVELQDQRKKVDAGKYETKYRDLKESFRLYRKKAKEIFLAQQQGETGFMPTLNDQGAEVAKVAYLKNLMVNYLASDTSVREHMEPAIATVLNFSDEDLQKIKKQKSESWF
mmetsp:Transcript_25991/g.53876  ORF Transcript_25991/g.53876 Transcript_25991/m.53876 type:complete len:528 (+) Transcript_25991:61-1644(+)